MHTTTAALHDARRGDTPENTATLSSRVAIGPVIITGLPWRWCKGR